MRDVMSMIDAGGQAEGATERNEEWASEQTKQIRQTDNQTIKWASKPCRSHSE
jgi:hypothetical protein